MKALFQRPVLCLSSVGIICLAASCGLRKEAQEPPAASPTPAAALIAQADDLYAQRQDLVRLRQAIILLRQARNADPGSYDAAWRLAKFDYYLASHTDSGGERGKAFRDGIEAGKVAVKLQDDKPDGHFWLGANYGGTLEAGAASLLGLATVNDVRNEMKSVLRLDEGYQNGSAYMVLGLVDLKAPKLLGGDQQKAVEEMEKGLRFGEGNALLRLHLAECYLAVNRREDARKQFNAIINMTPDPHYLPEYDEAAAEARKQLDKIK